MSADCCTYDCRQGDDCPVRKAGHTATALNTDNSDGSSAGHAEDELLDDTGLLLCQGLALVVFIVSIVTFASR